jgi:hypothetical protein
LPLGVYMAHEPASAMCERITQKTSLLALCAPTPHLFNKFLINLGEESELLRDHLSAKRFTLMGRVL